MNLRSTLIATAGLALVLATLSAGPAGAQSAADDPYTGLAPPASLQAAPPLQAAAICPTACFALNWRSHAPVIDITGFGFVGVEGATAATLFDPLAGYDKLYVSHGYSFGDRAVLRVYDPVTDTWSIGPAPTVVRSELAGAAAGGKLYAFGGRPSIAAVESFDPALGGLWSPAAAMPTPRSGLGAATLRGDVHTVGGRLGGAPLNGPGLSVHEVYDPASNTWSPRAPLPVPAGDVYATTSLAGRLFVFGGWSGFGALNATQIYDPVSDTWAVGAPVPTPRSNAVAGPLAGRLVVIGGLDPIGFNSTTTEVYDPVFDTWCTAPPKPTPGSEIAASDIRLGNALHAVGSGAFGLNLRSHEALAVDLVGCACPRTQGYWKTHRGWPLDGFALGGLFYTQAELRKLLRTPVRGDASLILAHQLIAAKLNFAAGAERPDAVTAAILESDALLASFPGTLPFGVHPSTPAGQAMEAAARLLDSYNNGFAGAPCAP